MRRLLKDIIYKFYNKVVMSTSYPVARRRIMSVVEYIILPEHRKYEYHILKNLRKSLLLFLFAAFCFMALKTIMLDNQVGIINVEWWKAKKENTFLKEKAKEAVYQQAIDSFKMSGAYLRYQVFKETGIVVPDKMSDEHVAIAVLEARKNNIPLRILFRVINHESGYDSNAINPASNAWGFMQTLPSTFNGFYKELGLTGGKTSSNNIRAGIARLKFGHDFWKKKKDSIESWRLAIAAYAIGDSLPRALNCVPDTVKSYVDYIMK